MKLTGYNLSLESLAAIVSGQENVSLASKARQRMEESRDIVIDALDREEAIYGLNTGVGKNKDLRISREEIEAFNKQLIYAHCVGIEPELSIEEVRASMLLRLNGLIKGYAGCQPAIADLLVQFLNLQITPVVNGKGSVGEGDIGILSYIGLALMGEGWIDYQGQRYAAAEIFERFSLIPIRFQVKDGLSVISSNAVSHARLSLLILKLHQLLKWFDLAYALSLEALNGNVTPLDEGVLASKHLTGQSISVQHVKHFLQGSYLTKKRSQTVQDPLSFRNAPFIHGAVYDALAYAEKNLLAELDSSDDNPIVDRKSKRILSTPNFETLNVSLAVEMLNVSLNHLSHASVQRMLKLSNPDFTNLPRFLRANDQQYFGLQALQKTAATLDVEIHHACQTLSNVSYPLAGDMEDRQTNLPVIIHHTQEIVHRLYQLLAIEILYASQALSLRFSDKRPLGHMTSNLSQMVYEQYGVLQDNHQLYAIINSLSEQLSQGKVDDFL